MATVEPAHAPRPPRDLVSHAPVRRDALRPPDPGSDPRVALISGVGGLMVMGIGFNLLEVAVIRVSSFLPALFLAPVLYTIAQAFQGKG